VAHRWSTGVLFAAVCVAVGFGLPGCAGGPTERPIKMGPGPGTLEAARRAFEGTWTLVSAEIPEASTDRLRAVKASGQLTYDAYGNLSVHVVVDDPAFRDASVLEFQGRIVIDPERKVYYAEDLAPARTVDPDQVAMIARDKVRHYELTATTLAVTYVDKAGKTTAVIRWKR